MRTKITLILTIIICFLCLNCGDKSFNGNNSSGIDTLWVEKDTYIGSDNSTGGDREIAGINFGDTAELHLVNEYWEDLQYDSMFNWIRIYVDFKTDGLMQLPNLDNYHADSIVLVLSHTNSHMWNSNHELFRAYPITEQWDEQTVNWNNAPQYDLNNAFEINADYDNNWQLRINISDPTNPFRSEFGAYIEANKRYVHSIETNFYSSESAIYQKRPFIILYR